MPTPSDLLLEITALLRQGRFEEVIGRCQQANDLPNPRCIYTYARALQQLGRNDEALAAFGRCAIEPDTTIDLARDCAKQTGFIHCAQGNFQAARDAFQKELKIQTDAGYEVEQNAQGSPLLSRLPADAVSEIFAHAIRPLTPLRLDKPVVIFGLIGTGRTYVTDLFRQLGIPAVNIYDSNVAHQRLQDWRDGHLDWRELNGNVLSVHLARQHWLGFGDPTLLQAVLEGDFHFILVNRHPMDCFVSNYLYWLAQKGKHIILGKSALSFLDKAPFFDSHAEDWIRFVVDGKIDVDQALLERPGCRAITLPEWAAETEFFRQHPRISEFQLEQFITDRLKAISRLCASFASPLGLREWEQCAPPKTHAHYFQQLLEQAPLLKEKLGEARSRSPDIWNGSIERCGYSLENENAH